MQVHEHAQTAQEPASRLAKQFLGVSDHEFMAGDNLQASEKLWGAASHAVMAVAQQRGWRYSKHRDLKRAARKLSEETGDPTLRTVSVWPRSSTLTTITTSWKSFRSMKTVYMSGTS